MLQEQNDGGKVDGWNLSSDGKTTTVEVKISNITSASSGTNSNSEINYQNCLKQVQIIQ